MTTFYFHIRKKIGQNLHVHMHAHTMVTQQETTEQFSRLPLGEEACRQLPDIFGGEPCLGLARDPVPASNLQDLRAQRGGDCHAYFFLQYTHTLG